jgi:hypothetical protein
MHEPITPFLQSELDYRRDRVRAGAARRQRPRPWVRRSGGRTDGIR